MLTELRTTVSRILRNKKFRNRGGKRKISTRRRKGIEESNHGNKEIRGSRGSCRDGEPNFSNQRKMEEAPLKGLQLIFQKNPEFERDHNVLAFGR